MRTSPTFSSVFFLLPACCMTNTHLTRCNKWEHGEIPDAHARFLGLRGDYNYNDQAGQKDAPSRNIPQPEEALLAAATAGGVSLRRGEGDIEGGLLEVSGETAGREEGGKFITYWSEIGTDRPVKWVFFTDAYFQVGQRRESGVGGGGRISRESERFFCFVCGLD